MTTRVTTGAEATDAELVSESLVGNRDAFGQIVARYQSLVCSLAYSATGCLGQSEDLAQETFFTAWEHLGELREPGMLRSWLCGIARNRINNSLRRESRKPLTVAEPLETAHDEPAPGPLPPDLTISKEEEAILWRALERIPETYREPLVLFYREHQSIERVAEELDLSEDAVKQRLSRGRKLLHEQVLAFVEGALERTAPGKAFTLGVLAALPVFATSASAATVAAAAAKGSATATGAGLVTVFNALFGPVVGILGFYFGVRSSLDAARTPRERQFVVRQTKSIVVWMVLLSAVVAAYVFAAVHWWSTHPVLFTVLGVSLPLLFAGSILVTALRFHREFRRICEAEEQDHPELFQDEMSVTMSMFKEYRSRWTLLGLPLLHVRTGARPGEKMGTAKGWIAIGDRAYGILFASGAVAVGGISIGGAAVGLIAIGGVSAGLLAVGGLALGGLAMGGCAIGIVAAGAVAIGLIGAEGWLAVAREFALGGPALAQHANDAAAREYFGQFPWMDTSKAGNRTWWMTLWSLPMLLVIWQGVRARKWRRRLAEQRTRHSEHSLLCLTLLSLALLGTGCSRAPGGTSTVSSLALTNGIRVVAVCFPASTNVSIFTFLPMGLTSDGPEQAQWSHLVEHLVIRSTVPANSPLANGETLPDHMRLDFYGNLANWKEGLSHHRRWLEGVPFTEASLTAETPNVIAECDFTARNLATHKFAAAAWSHGFRHSRKLVTLKADVKRAGLSDVQKLRDERLVVSNQVTVCVVSGLQSAEVFAGVQKQLGGLSLRSVPPLAAKTTPRTLDLTWDLDARHLLVTWPIPDRRQEDHAALMVAGQCLNMLLASDPQLTQQAGMIFAGSDLTTPEGDFFFVSASLRPGSTFAELCKTIQTHVGRLSSDASTLAQAPFIAAQLAASLTTLPNSELIKAQSPPGISMAMIEGNLGLQLGMSEHRYGAHRPALARQLATVTAGKVQQSVRTHLAQEKCSVCTLAAATSPSTGN